MISRLTPRTIVQYARLAAVVAVLGLVYLMLGPFQGLEAALGLSDKAAHAIAFFAATTGLFLIAPGWRRGDIALGAIGFGLLIELLQGLTGRSMSATDVLADVVGIAVALVPGLIEQLRWMARTHPDRTLGEILALDRRRSGEAIRPTEEHAQKGVPDAH